MASEITFVDFVLEQIKNSGRKFIGNVVEATPYEGAKPSFLIEDKIEDCEWLSELVRISLNELPAPKPKKKK